jgi:uncharacterized protein YcnI
VNSRLIRPGTLAAAAALGLGACLLLAAPASAHAEVEIEPAQAGATDAVITVVPEAHNHHAGAVMVQVFLPEGIAAGEVTLVDGPEGWEVTIDEDSYTISGAELEIDTDPWHQVRVRALPHEPVIYFRILTTYSDGQVDRWIEIPSQANPDPANAAPGVELAAAATPAPASPPQAPAVTTPAPAVTTPAGEASEDRDRPGAGLVIAVIAVAVVVAATAAGLAIRRRRPGGDAGAG